MEGWEWLVIIALMRCFAGRAKAGVASLGIREKALLARVRCLFHRSRIFKPSREDGMAIVLRYLENALWGPPAVSFKRVFKHEKYLFWLRLHLIWNFELYGEIENIVANTGSQMRSVLIIACDISNVIRRCATIYLSIYGVLNWLIRFRSIYRWIRITRSILIHNFVELRLNVLQMHSRN